MRLTACFGIIILHSLFASTVYFSDEMSKGDVLYEKIAEHMLMWCVPLFLMITGALLLEPVKEVGAKKLFGKYLKRIALALVSFFIIFKILETVIEDKPFSFSESIFQFMRGESWAHMWYLYLMISIYLMLPVYKAISARLSYRWLTYFVTLMLIFTSIGPVLNTLGFPIDAFSIPVSTIYPSYLFVGYLLFKCRPPARYGWLLLILSTAMIVMITIISLDGGVHDSGVAKTMDNVAAYSSIFVVMQTSGIFILLNNKEWNWSQKADTVISSMDSCTFGIYLIHMIGIRWVMKWIGVNPYMYGPFFFILLALVLFAGSYIVTLGIRKISDNRLL